MTIQKLVSRLLGSIDWLGVEGIRVSNGQIWVNASSVQTESHCPLCGVASRSIHSHYGRTLQDLAWGGFLVKIGLKVRRFRCGVVECERRVFTERFLSGVVSYARRMCRLSDLLSGVGIQVGGTSGARITKLMAIKTSPSTVLRQIHRLEIPKESSTVDKLLVIGVDDYAFKKRKSYGTVIVNLETNKAVDLLPDRSSGELAKWLKNHPQIKTIARDRSTEYAKGIAEGAPKAETVLDRFHLIKNVGEVLERVVQQHLGAIKAIAQKWGIRPRKRTSKEEQMREERRKTRHLRYQEIRQRHDKGDSISHIMRTMGISRTQIRRAIHADQLPERHGNHHQGSILEPYQPHLQKRWDEGVRNASQLFREIANQGFLGTPKQIYRWAQERREQPYKHKALDLTTKAQQTADNNDEQNKNIDNAPTPRFSEVGLAPRQLAWLLRRDDTALEEQERMILNSLLDAVPQLKTAQMLTRQFQQLFHDNKADATDTWLQEATESGIAEFKSLAASLKREREALKAAVTLSWSNGPVEGWVNKIKFIKRQMYGRASFDLLRKRVLLSP